MTSQSRSKGRPPKDKAEALRAKVWYLAVKSRGGWSDYRLDIEFARSENETPRRGLERHRAFEEVKRKEVLPTNGTHWRRKYDLVGNIDAHANFSGTAAYFHSTFWTLVKATPMSLEAVKPFVYAELERTGLHRPSGELDMVLGFQDAKIAAGKGLPFLKQVARYRTSLELFVKTSPLNLDLFALLGGLFTEAYLAGALETALILKELCLAHLEEFCGQDWLKVDGTGQRVIELVEDRVFRIKTWDGFQEDHGYDDDPAMVVTRPLYPLNDAMKSLIQNEKRLFQECLEETNRVWNSDN